MNWWKIKRLLHDVKVYLLWLYSTVLGKVSFIILISLILIVIGSALLFAHLEGLDIFESLYWAIITITTVGYGDIVPHNFTSRMLAIGVALSGYAGLTAALSLIVNSLVNRAIKEREGDINVKGTRILVVGSSNVCYQITQLLKHEIGSRGRIVWLTSYDPELSKWVSQALDNNIVVVRGNLTSPESYFKAGIETAHDVIICGKDDRESVAVALSLRTIEGYLTYIPRIIAITHSERSERILTQELGVDVTVPTKTLGYLLLEALKEPTTTLFLTALSESHPKLIEMEIIRVASKFDFAKIGTKLYYIGTKGIYQVSEVIKAVSKRRGKYVHIVAKVAGLEQIQPVTTSDYVGVGDKVLAVEFEK